VMHFLKNVRGKHKEPHFQFRIPKPKPRIKM